MSFSIILFGKIKCWLLFNPNRREPGGVILLYPLAVVTEAKKCFQTFLMPLSRKRCTSPSRTKVIHVAERDIFDLQDTSPCAPREKPAAKCLVVLLDCSLIECLSLLACNKACYCILNLFGLGPVEWPGSPFCRFDFPLEFCCFAFSPLETPGLSITREGFISRRIEPFWTLALLPISIPTLRTLCGMAHKDLNVHTRNRSAYVQNMYKTWITLLSD